MDIKPTIAYEDFAKLDLRVAQVVAAEPHPNADRLLKLQLDLGGQTRQVCAGVRAYYQPEDLVGRQVVIIANLAPRTIRGEQSEGMALAATEGSDGQIEDVVLLTPAKPVSPGSAVS